MIVLKYKKGNEKIKVVYALNGILKFLNLVLIICGLVKLGFSDNGSQSDYQRCLKNLLSNTCFLKTAIVEDGENSGKDGEATAATLLFF